MRKEDDVGKNSIKQWKALHRLFITMSYDTRSMISIISVAEILLFVYLVSREPSVG